MTSFAYDQTLAKYWSIAVLFGFWFKAVIMTFHHVHGPGMGSLGGELELVSSNSHSTPSYKTAGHFLHSSYSAHTPSSVMLTLRQVVILMLQMGELSGQKRLSEPLWLHPIPLQYGIQCLEVALGHSDCFLSSTVLCTWLHERLFSPGSLALLRASFQQPVILSVWAWSRKTSLSLGVLFLWLYLFFKVLSFSIQKFTS